MQYSPEDNIVEVKPNLKKDLQFYKLTILEKTNCNGVINKEEIVKNIHLTTTDVVNVGYQFHVEVFDRLHRNRELALSEKDLIDQIASITDDVKILINEDLNFVKLTNFDLIKKKAKQKINILSKKYLGEIAVKLFNNLDFFYTDEKLIFKDLQRYDKLGLLIPKFLGYHRFGKTDKYKIRYTNFLKNTFLEVNESIKMTRLNRAIQEVELQLKGEINSENFNKKMFEREMKVQDIYFDDKKESPKIDKYEGVFIFNTTSGKINKGEVEIVFSFGKNYSKEIKYQIVTINADEL